MKMANNQNCPVCQTGIPGDEYAFCPQCGWELIIISANASQGLKELYEEKLKRHKSIMQERNALNTQNVSNAELIRELNEKKASLESQVGILNSEIEKHLKE